jgi:hypothetical protein
MVSSGRFDGNSKLETWGDIDVTLDRRLLKSSMFFEVDGKGRRKQK